MLGIVIWVRRIISKILFVFPWLKPRKSDLTNKPIEIKKTKRNKNKEYRVKVCANLYVIDDQGNERKDPDKKMLSSKFYTCEESEAIKQAYEEMYNYYKSMQKEVELNDKELIVSFEDGIKYRFAEATTILYTDNSFKKRLRELNNVLKNKMMAELKK